MQNTTNTYVKMAIDTNYFTSSKNKTICKVESYTEGASIEVPLCENHIVNYIKLSLYASVMK